MLSGKLQCLQGCNYFRYEYLQGQINLIVFCSSQSVGLFLILYVRQEVWVSESFQGCWACLRVGKQP